MASRKEQILQRYSILEENRRPLEAQLAEIKAEQARLENELASTPADLLNLDYTGKMNKHLQEKGLLPK